MASRIRWDTWWPPTFRWCYLHGPEPLQVSPPDFRQTGPLIETAYEAARAFLGELRSTGRGRTARHNAMLRVAVLACDVVLHPNYSQSSQHAYIGYVG
jgi:hypothetical protein